MRRRQKGNVIAEAVVISGVLISLISAVNLSGRWQFGWLKQHLHTQTMATALAFEHHRPTALGKGLRVSGTPQFGNTNRTLAEREFRLGEEGWLGIQDPKGFQQHAWRLVGTGQISNNSDVTLRLEQAHTLWKNNQQQSLQAVAPLRIALDAVNAPWRSRGDMTNWLFSWQESTPKHYLTPPSDYQHADSFVMDAIEAVLRSW